MSLHQLAKHVQAEGRGDDTELIHMTPSEIKGLQALAMRHGGSLTINPKTGLPEAGFLSSILPTVVGAGVGIMTMNPMAGAAVGGAMGMAMNKGSLKSGIMSGIGAYGMGSLGAGMMGAGEAALGAEAATAGATAGDALFSGNQAMADMGITSMNDATAAFKAGTISPETYANMAEQYSSQYANAANAATKAAGPWDTLTKGFQATKFDTDYLKKNAMPIGAAGIGILGASGMFDQQQPGMINAPAQSPSYIRPYTYSQTRNTNWGQPGQPYFNQAYTAQTPVDASQWGARGFAEGGLAALADGGRMRNQPANVNFMGGDMYPQSQISHSYYATPIQMPTSAQQVAANYEPRTNPLTGQMTANMADGGQVKGYAAGGPTGQVDLHGTVSLGGNQGGNPMIGGLGGLGGLNASSYPLMGQRELPLGPPTTLEQSRIGTTPMTDSTQFAEGGVAQDVADYNAKIAAQAQKEYPQDIAQQARNEYVLGQSNPGSTYKAPAVVPVPAAAPAANNYDPNMLAMYYAANPNNFNYNAATQSYGIAAPTQAQYDAFVEEQQRLLSPFGNLGRFSLGSQAYAQGGLSSLGSYSDGGQLLKGPGDGVSDHIPAQIGKHQPARLADGEFVVPARIVSELGNGSTDAGAKRLYAMMDRVQNKRKKSMGKGKFAVDSKAEKDLPA